MAAILFYRLVHSLFSANLLGLANNYLFYKPLQFEPKVYKVKWPVPTGTGHFTLVAMEMFTTTAF
jgi:hypothetical protein